ncbi:MAG: hypothetical protein KDE31_29500, partial [Caldilineaceae bacterium]|nr:hypothetical protein [Caldilineaceae bacterium]
TTHWQPGWMILDEYQIPLPADLLPGTYLLATGIYQPSGEHLPPISEENAGSLPLGTVEIE